jgi:hypothetical protein
MSVEVEAETKKETSESRRVQVLFHAIAELFRLRLLIHSLLMRNSDPAVAEVHVACNRGRQGEPSASLKALAQIPDSRVRPNLASARTSDRCPFQ